MADEDKELDLSFTRTTKDIAVAALAGAVIAALLVLGVYFGFRGDFVDQGRKVADVDNRLTRQAAVLEGRLAALEGLPEQLRQQFIRQGLDDMTRTASFLRAQMANPVHKKKLVQIGALLRELDQDYPPPAPEQGGE